MTINVHNYKTREDAVNKVSSLGLNKVHQVKITCKRGKRTIDQNSLYWMWLSCISDNTGEDTERLHRFFKAKYILKENISLFGENIESEPTTTNLDTKQFTEYLNKIQVFASSELGINLPNPEDINFEQFKGHYSKFI